MARIGKLGDRGREAEGLEAPGVAATGGERGDKSLLLPRMEMGQREREEHLHQLLSNPRQKTKKTKSKLCSPPHTHKVNTSRVQFLFCMTINFCDQESCQFALNV